MTEGIKFKIVREHKIYEIKREDEIELIKREITEKTRKKMSESHKGEKNYNFGKKLPESTRKKMREASRKRWQDENFIKKWFRANQRHPNSIENIVDEILQKNHPNEWKYNGNYEAGVTIGGMIPDFVNVNGFKTVIEVFGDYWHGDKKTKNKWKHTEFGRKAAYSQLGFICVVLWEKELKKDNAERYILDKMGECENERTQDNRTNRKR